MFDFTTLNHYQVCFLFTLVLSVLLANVWSNRHPEEWDELMDNLYFAFIFLVLAVIICFTYSQRYRNWLKNKIIVALGGPSAEDLILAAKVHKALELELESSNKKLNMCEEHKLDCQQAIELKDGSFATLNQEHEVLKNKGAELKKENNYWLTHIDSIAKDRNDLWRRIWDSESDHIAISHKLENRDKVIKDLKEELVKKDQLIKTTTDQAQHTVEKSEAAVSETQKTFEDLQAEIARLEKSNESLQLYLNLAGETVERQDAKLKAIDFQEQVLEEEKFGKIKKSLQSSKKLTKKAVAKNTELENMVKTLEEQKKDMEKALEKQKKDMMKTLEKQKEDVKRDLLSEMARHQKDHAKKEIIYKARIHQLLNMNRKFVKIAPRGHRFTKKRGAAAVRKGSKEELSEKMDIDYDTLQEAGFADNGVDWMQIE